MLNTREMVYAHKMFYTWKMLYTCRMKVNPLKSRTQFSGSLTLALALLLQIMDRFFSIFPNQFMARYVDF